MIVAEVSLDDGGPCVQQTPAQDTKRTAYGAQIVHRSGYCEDADSEDDFQEDDGRSRPFDCAEIDASSSLEDLELLIVVRVENSASGRPRSVVLHVGLRIVLVFLLRW